MARDVLDGALGAEGSLRAGTRAAPPRAPRSKADRLGIPAATNRLRPVLRLANRAARRAFPRATSSPIHPDALLERAQRAVPGASLGEGSAERALRVLCSSLSTEANLTPLGRWLAGEALRSALENRLEVDLLARSRPEIFQQRVERPVFIVGPPRTGTTLLHRMLAAADDVRAPRFYEMGQPCTGPDRIDSLDRRERDARRSLAVLGWALPGARAIHDIEAAAPEECVMLMANDLVSFGFCIEFDVPSYWDWLEELDLTVAYRNHRRQVQVLQHAGDTRRWVFKAPAHLLGAGALLRAYPDAVIVHTSRDPEAVRDSAVSLLATSQSMSTDRIDRARLRRRVEESFVLWTDRFARARREAGDDVAFIDVAYDELLDDPVGVAEAVRRAAGLTTTRVVREQMARYVAEHPQHKHGRHDYGAPRDP